MQAQVSSLDIASPEEIATCLNAVYQSHRWYLSYGEGKGASATVLSFYASGASVVTRLYQGDQEKLRSMSFSVIEGLRTAGFCNQDTSPGGYLDSNRGTFSIPWRAFNIHRINETKRAISIRDSLNLVSNEGEFKTNWEISSDLSKEGPVVQAAVGSMREDNPGDAQTCLAKEGSLYAYGKQSLITGIIRDFQILGIIADDKGLFLSPYTQPAYGDSFDEGTVLDLVLCIPIHKIVSEDGARHFAASRAKSKPLCENFARLVPFIEDFVEETLQQAPGSSAVNVPASSVRGLNGRKEHNYDTFKVSVCPMTPSTPSVHIEVHCKEAIDATAVEKRLRSSRLDTQIEESNQRGYAQMLRVYNCSSLEFLGFIESRVKISLRDAVISSQVGPSPSAVELKR